MVKVMFEIGATIKGFKSAMKLLDMCKYARGDYIKVQCFDVDALIADRNQMFTYETNKGETITRELYDVLKDRCLTKEEWKSFFNEVQQAGLEVCATVCEPDYLEMCLESGVRSIKISSSDIDYWPLISYIRDNQTRIRELHFDCGNANMKEVDWLASHMNINIIDLVAHHCPSIYGAYATDQDLAKIRTLKKELPQCKVAFSDHSRYPCTSHMAATMAVAMGVSHIEKCVSLNRDDRGGPEFVQSIDNKEVLEEYVCNINDACIILGNESLEIDEEKSFEHRRGMYAKKDLKAGDLADPSLFEFRRPRTKGGVSPMIPHDYEGTTRLIEPIEKGELFRHYHIGQK